MEVKAPSFPESISEGELVQWYKEEGEFVERDELLADVETEKTTMEITAPLAGLLLTHLKAVGDLIESEEVLAIIDESAAQQKSEAQVPPETEAKTVVVEEGIVGTRFSCS